MQILMQRVWVGPEMLLSNLFPGEAQAASQGTTLEVARTWGICGEHFAS